MATSAQRPYLPALTTLVALGLTLYYFAVFRPLSDRERAADRPLTAEWNLLVGTNRAGDITAVPDLEGFPSRLEQLRMVATNLQSAQQLVAQRTALPPEVAAPMREPFQLVDFQNARQRLAEGVMRLAKERGIPMDPGATNGFPEYSADMVEPGLLWARLHAAHQLLVSAVACKASRIVALEQLPAVSFRAQADGFHFLEELPLRLEVVGSHDAINRLLASLPLPAGELSPLGLNEILTNKPVLFLGSVLMRKHAPEKPDQRPKPDEIRLEASVSVFVPLSDPEARAAAP